MEEQLSMLLEMMREQREEASRENEKRDQQAEQLQQTLQLATDYIFAFFKQQHETAESVADSRKELEFVKKTKGERLASVGSLTTCIQRFEPADRKELPAAVLGTGEELPGAVLDAGKELPGAVRDAGEELPAAVLGSGEELPGTVPDAGEELPAAVPAWRRRGAAWSRA